MRQAVLAREVAPAPGLRSTAAPKTASAGLRVSEAHDAFEQEADRAAKEVMANGGVRAGWSFSKIGVGTALQRKCACGGSAGVGGECEECKKEKILQRRAAASTTPSVVPPIVDEVLRSPGQPLNTATRRFMESRFRHDFSHVRVHTDARATESTGAVSALAYTVGGHLVFGTGLYRPETEDGRQLIAHELTHVLQQGQGPIASRLHFDSDASPMETQAQALSREVSAASEFRGTPIASEATTKYRQSPEGAEKPGYLQAQSGAGAAKRLLQRRRIPDEPGLSAALPTDAGFAEARTGLARAISRAWGEMNDRRQAKVRSAVSGLGISWGTEADLLNQLSSATREQLLSFAQAIRSAAEFARLGDPLLIDAGPRPGTDDAKNIQQLVNRASGVLSVIISGGAEVDADLAQVFGAANVAAAKAKYAAARTRMQELHTANKILTDRSGYSGEVGQEGVSTLEQVGLDPEVIDNPTKKMSIITFIHESMHAGNSDIDDSGGYIGQPSFTVQPAGVKLTNAAHFEIVPRRLLEPEDEDDYLGQTFIPAGTTEGGVTQAPETPAEKAVSATSQRFRQAWSAGTSLHALYVRVFKAPTEWDTLELSKLGGPGGAHFADTLPFWSKVEMLTIHTRSGSINPTGPPAVRPVTLIDISLSEGLTRKLAQGIKSSPEDTDDAQELEKDSATPSERTAAAASVEAERDLLIRLVIKTELGDLTGGLDRDERVVARLAQAEAAPDLSDFLVVRPPSEFP